MVNHLYVQASAHLKLANESLRVNKEYFEITLQKPRSFWPAGITASHSCHKSCEKFVVAMEEPWGPGNQTVLNGEVGNAQSP